MKTRNMVLVSMAFILTTALMVSFSMSKVNLLIQGKEMPVFFGEELIVQNAEKAVGALKVEKAVRVGRAVKAQVTPAPKISAPLPIFPPKVTYQVLPQYPMTILERGLSGTTLLSIYVGLNGKPEKVELKSSSGLAEMDQSAIAAVSQWIFEPARQGGQAIASWFEIPVRFEVK